MKKIICLLGFMYFFLGCASYNSNARVDSITPDASVQLLRNVPLLKASKNVTFFNKNNVDKLSDFFKLKQYNENFPIVDKDMEKVYILSEDINKFLKNSHSLFGNKIFLNILYCQNSIINNDDKINSCIYENYYNSTIQRKDMLEKEIRKNLLFSGFNITDNKENAKYEMNVTVIEDGMTEKKMLSLFHRGKTVTGVVSLNVQIIDIENNDVIITYNVKNSAYISNIYILHVFLMNSSSEDISLEYSVGKK